MRLKVKQNLNWVIQGNNNTETCGAKAACEIKLTAQSLFSVRLRQVPAVGEWYAHHNQFRELNNRKSEKMRLRQIQAEVTAQFCAVSCLILSKGLFSL